MTEPSHEEATRLVAEILGQYMADWSPEDIREALSDVESVTVYVPPRPERSESPMPITILDYVKFQIGEKDSYSAEDFHSAGVDIMGGCEGCAATIAGYNAYPSRSGYWRCADCIGNTGFATVEDFMNFEPRTDNDYSPAPPRPAIVCLCGSTRFADEFNRQRIALTHAGQIVLSIEIVTTQAPGDDPQHVDPWLKARLDALHKAKIDLADYVLVLNVGQYIGPSTRSEIDYAIKIGKPVRYLEPPDPDQDGQDDLGGMNCPSCGEVTSISEIRVTVSERADSYAFQCGECSAVWSP